MRVEGNDATKGQIKRNFNLLILQCCEQHSFIRAVLLALRVRPESLSCPAVHTTRSCFSLEKQDGKSHVVIVWSLELKFPAAPSESPSQKYLTLQNVESRIGESSCPQRHINQPALICARNHWKRWSTRELTKAGGKTHHLQRCTTTAI